MRDYCPCRCATRYASTQHPAGADRADTAVDVVDVMEDAGVWLTGSLLRTGPARASGVAAGSSTIGIMAVAAARAAVGASRWSRLMASASLHSYAATRRDAISSTGAK